MTAQKPQRDAARDEAAFTANQLAKHCHSGDIASFHEAFNDYLSKHSADDPFGRMPLEIQLLERGMSGINAFRVNPPRSHGEVLASQLKVRWEAWMSILPLDLQLHLLIRESSSDFPGMVDPATLKWNQWWDIQASADPDSAYASSALCEIDYLRGPEEVLNTWDITQDRLILCVRVRAMQVMYEKSWKDLDALMDAGRMHAREALDQVHLRYTDEDFSTRAFQFKAVKPLPLWTMGLFTGATEPGFWEVMQRFGGPCGPEEISQEMANPAARMPQLGQPGFYMNLAPCPPSAEWGNPLSWVVCEPLHPGLIAEIERTRVSWVHESMESGVRAPNQVRGAPRGPSRL